jgi:hypothetical protein
MPQLVAEVTTEEDAAATVEEVACAAGAVSGAVAGLVTVDEAGEAASIEFDWDAAAAEVPDDAGAAALAEVEPWAPVVGAVAEAPLSPPPPPHALNAATKNKRDAWTILFKMRTPA